MGVVSRLLPKPSHFRLLSHLSSIYPKSHAQVPPPPSTFPPCHHLICRPFSTNNNNNNSSSSGSSNRDHQSSPNIWQLSEENEETAFDSLFTQESGSIDSPDAAAEEVSEEKPSSWLMDDENSSTQGDIFASIDSAESTSRSPSVGMGGRDDDWLTTEASEEKQWTFAEEDEGKVFDFGDSAEVNDGGVDFFGGETQSPSLETKRSAEADKMLQQEEKRLTEILKGPKRAFGDLIAASGITDAMLDSLIALRDFEGVQGLPPLKEIEDMRYEKNTRKSTRAEIERQKQEEVAKTRVRDVDDKGRAYGTGRRKCSIARVWIQPGDGKFIVNDKQFDVYFPMLDHRAALLRPFSETKTLGLWDVSCTVQGGGVSGQVGAIQLGISRALQNWEPDLHPCLKAGGFLTRDPRVVERKKPGKAKARKSFQWVKR